MLRMVLAVHRHRPEFRRLFRIAARVAMENGGVSLEVASSEEELEENAHWNLAGHPVVTVAGRDMILLNARSPHLSTVLKQAVGS